MSCILNLTVSSMDPLYWPFPRGFLILWWSVHICHQNWFIFQPRYPKGLFIYEAPLINRFSGGIEMGHNFDTSQRSSTYIQMLKIWVKNGTRPPSPHRKYWPFWVEFTGHRWIHFTKGSIAENVSIWWRHHYRHGVPQASWKKNISARATYTQNQWKNTDSLKSLHLPIY